MPSLRRATRPGQRLQSVTGFLSTLSLRRATFQGPGLVRHGVDFYPRSPCGERPRSRKISTRPCQFLSTLSLRRATVSAQDRPEEKKHFNPRSPCGERPIFGEINTGGSKFLSTLSLRRATYQRKIDQKRRSISIHALLAESDCGCFARYRFWAYFYPRSPCGERLKTFRTVSVKKTFLSTLSLRRATQSMVVILILRAFLSTLSLRRATEML